MAKYFLGDMGTCFPVKEKIFTEGSCYLLLKGTIPLPVNKLKINNITDVKAESKLKDFRSFNDELVGELYLQLKYEYTNDKLKEPLSDNLIFSVPFDANDFFRNKKVTTELKQINIEKLAYDSLFIETIIVLNSEESRTSDKKSEGKKYFKDKNTYFIPIGLPKIKNPLATEVNYNIYAQFKDEKYLYFKGLKKVKFLYKSPNSKGEKFFVTNNENYFTKKIKLENLEINSNNINMEVENVKTTLNNSRELNIESIYSVNAKLIKQKKKKVESIKEEKILEKIKPQIEPIEIENTEVQDSDENKEIINSEEKDIIIKDKIEKEVVPDLERSVNEKKNKKSKPKVAKRSKKISRNSHKERLLKHMRNLKSEVGKADGATLCIKNKEKK